MRTFVFSIHHVEKFEDSSKNMSAAKVYETILVDGRTELKLLGMAYFKSAGIGALSEVKNYLIKQNILDEKYKVKPYSQYSLAKAEEFGVLIYKI